MARESELVGAIDEIWKLALTSRNSTIGRLLKDDEQLADDQPL